MKGPIIENETFHKRGEYASNFELRGTKLKGLVTLLNIKMFLFMKLKITVEC